MQRKSLIPVFIGGCDRSGTTMLGSMLGAHKTCLCTPESQFKIDVLRSCEDEDGATDNFAALDMIKNHWRFKIWNFDPTEAIEEEFESYSHLLRRIVIKYGESIGKTNAHIWIDHTPSNVRYATTLLRLFPNMKMIHIVRDGRAVAASIMSLHWGPNTIVDAAHWWLEMLAYGLAVESFLNEGQIIRVRYEDLVYMPEKTLRGLCEYLDIDFQPDMVRGKGFTPPSYTAEQHTLVGKKPNADRATNWKQALTSRQIEIFESLTCEALSYLGYPLKYGITALPPTFLEKRLASAKKLWGKVVNQIMWGTRKYRVLHNIL